MFRFHEKNVEASTRASARKRKRFDSCTCEHCFTSCSSIKGRFHGEIRTLALALVFAFDFLIYLARVFVLVLASQANTGLYSKDLLHIQRWCYTIVLSLCMDASDDTQVVES